MILASLGRADWVERWTQRLKSQFAKGRSLGQADLPNNSWLIPEASSAAQLASACEALVACIAAKIAEHRVDQVLVAGGGWQNLRLRQALKRHIAQPVETCEAYGPPSDYREAAAMALLGGLAWDGVPMTLAQVTGSSADFCSGLKIDPILAS